MTNLDQSSAKQRDDAKPSSASAVDVAMDAVSGQIWEDRIEHLHARIKEAGDCIAGYYSTRDGTGLDPDTEIRDLEQLLSRIAAAISADPPDASAATTAATDVPSGDTSGPSEGEEIVRLLLRRVSELLRGDERRYRELLSVLKTEPGGGGEESDRDKPAEPVESSTPAVDSLGSVEESVFRDGLTAYDGIERDMRSLTKDFLANDPGACSLVGSILLARTAEPERLPRILSEVGEACYRWRPKPVGSDTALEKCLADWLGRLCGEAEVDNAIELVRVDDQFDPRWHRSPPGVHGVQVTNVLGWVVVREDGTALSRANVEVR